MRGNRLRWGVVIFSILFCSRVVWAEESKTIEVWKNLFTITHSKGTNSNTTFLVTKEGVIIIDTGVTPAEARKVKEAVRKQTQLPILYIINTNYHGDHSFGNQVFKDSHTIIAHENVRKALTQESGKEYLAFFKTLKIPGMDETVITPPNMIFKDKDDIKFFRNRLNQNLNEILNSKKKISLDIDNQILKPPHFELSYDEYDNLEINKKCVKFFKKIYPQINKANILKNISKSKIKIGFISEYLTDHTIGKLYKGIILNLDKSKFDTVVFHTSKTKKGEIYKKFKNSRPFQS